MNPKTKANTSYGYIPLETTSYHDHDSTTRNPVNTKSTPIDEPPPTIVQMISTVFVMAFLVVCFVRATKDIGQERPKNVSPVDPIIQIKSASVSLFNLSASSITTKGELAFVVTKPNDCSVIFYDTIVVSLFHMKKPLSVAYIDSFFQNETENMTVKAILPPTVAHVEKPESQRMAREFSFDVNAKGRLWQDYWKSRNVMGEGRQMNVWCPGVKINIVMETGVGMMSGPAICKVNTYYD